MLIFGARCLPSLKNRQMCPQNTFSLFFPKILIFSKKLFNKKYCGILFVIKKVIFIFDARWSLTSCTAIQRPCHKQNKDLMGQYFYVMHFLRRRTHLLFSICVISTYLQTTKNSVWFLFSVNLGNILALLTSEIVKNFMYH